MNPQHVIVATWMHHVSACGPLVVTWSVEKMATCMQCHTLRFRLRSTRRDMVRVIAVTCMPHVSPCGPTCREMVSAIANHDAAYPGGAAAALLAALETTLMLSANSGKSCNNSFKILQRSTRIFDFRPFDSRTVWQCLHCDLR